jgi:hypothetical protein
VLAFTVREGAKAARLRGRVKDGTEPESYISEVLHHEFFSQEIDGVGSVVQKQLE